MYTMHFLACDEFTSGGLTAASFSGDDCTISRIRKAEIVLSQIHQLRLQTVLKLAAKSTAYTGLGLQLLVW